MTSMVSIIIPCRNEARTILGLLESVIGQTWPIDHLEVLVIDGTSEDGTRDQIVQFASQHPGLRLRLVDNPRRTIPAALNLGIQAAQGDVVVRLDAHSSPRPDYIQVCLSVLERTQAANVGGVWDIQPGGPGWMARSIAIAAAHRLGAGDARYRTNGEAGWVDTVPFGAFPKAWLDRVGAFNEDLLTNEDYEFNTRLRQLGGRIWFDPNIRSVYYARPTLRELGRQYARYGFWKARMLHGYPASLRWRQALPPAFVAATLGLILLAPFTKIALWLLAVQWVGYALATAGAAWVEAARRRDAALIVGLPCAWWVMHLCWGSGFWAGWIAGLRRGRHELDSA